MYVIYLSQIKNVKLREENSTENEMTVLENFLCGKSIFFFILFSFSKDLRVSNQACLKIYHVTQLQNLESWCHFCAKIT